MNIIRPELINHNKLVYCIHPTCPKRDECLCQLAREIAPPYNVHYFTDPRQDPENCPHFRKNELVQLPRGFSTLRSEVKAGERRAFTWDLMLALGCERTMLSYYERGRYPLNLKQKANIEALCRTYGIEARFDAYEEGYQL